jgi:hypothetical protein
MANRVTNAQVLAVMESGIGIRDDTVTACVTAANALTDKVSAADSGGALSTALLVEIERWLAAHFTSIAYMQSQSEKTEMAAQTFFGKVDLNLNQTRYGQQAVILDITGFLAGLQRQAEKGSRFRISALGPVMPTGDLY